MVGFRRRVQPIDGISGEAHRRVETEGARRLDDVVVDRLRDAQTGDTALVKFVAIASVPSPPMTTSASRLRWWKGVDALRRTIAGRAGRVRAGERIAPVRGPRMVPPRAGFRAYPAASVPPVRRFEQAGESVLDSDRLAPFVAADFTTARITAFSPGASPPPVRMPIRTPGASARAGPVLDSLPRVYGYLTAPTTE